MNRPKKKTEPKLETAGEAAAPSAQAAPKAAEQAPVFVSKPTPKTDPEPKTNPDRDELLRLSDFLGRLYRESEHPGVRGDIKSWRGLLSRLAE